MSRAVLLALIGLTHAHASADSGGACDPRLVSWHIFRYSPTLVLQQGSASIKTAHGTMVYTVDDVQYRDLDGDGRVEAHVRIERRPWSAEIDRTSRLSRTRTTPMLQRWAFELDSACKPVPLGKTDFYFEEEERLFGGTYAIGSKAWSVHHNRFAPLPESDSIVASLRVELAKERADELGHRLAYRLARIDEQVPIADESLACLDKQSVEIADYKVKAAHAVAAKSAWLRAHAQARQMLATAAKRKTQRAAWEDASDAHDAALEALQAARQAWQELRDSAGRVELCARGIDVATSLEPGLDDASAELNEQGRIARRIHSSLPAGYKEAIDRQRRAIESRRAALMRGLFQRVEEAARLLPPRLVHEHAEGDKELDWPVDLMSRDVINNGLAASEE